MKLAQISSRAANLAWGPWKVKAKTLSDALGCLMLGSLECLCGSNSGSCSRLYSRYFCVVSHRSVIAQVRSGFAVSVYCKQTLGSCRSLQSECCLSSPGFRNSSLSFGEFPAMSLGKILVPVLGAKHLCRATVTWVLLLSHCFIPPSLPLMITQPELSHADLGVVLKF